MRQYDVDRIVLALVEEGQDNSSKYGFRLGNVIRFTPMQVGTILSDLDIEPERKRGNWEVIEAESWKGGAYARCSECGTGFAFGAFFEPDEFKFCPECGAEMEVNDDHND